MLVVLELRRKEICFETVSRDEEKSTYGFSSSCRNGERSFDEESSYLMEPSEHYPPKMFEIFSFLHMQKRQMVAGYDMLHDMRLGPPERGVVLVGTLVALGSVDEGMRVACKLQPLLSPLYERFKPELRCWYRLRNDAAHIFERAFDSPRKSQNVASFNGGRRIAGYDPSTDTIATGTDPEASVELWVAIGRAFEVCRLAKMIHIGFREGDPMIHLEPVEVLIEAMRDEIRYSRTR